MAEAAEMDNARRRYEFKKTLEKLQAKQGSGTELISLYIPPDKQIYDVTAQLRDEFGIIRSMGVHNYLIGTEVPNKAHSSINTANKAAHGKRKKEILSKAAHAITKIPVVMAITTSNVE